MFVVETLVTCTKFYNTGVYSAKELFIQLGHWLTWGNKSIIYGDKV